MVDIIMTAITAMSEVGPVEFPWGQRFIEVTTKMRADELS